MQKTFRHTLLVCAFAFLGGFASDQLFKVRDSHAEIAADIVKKDFTFSSQVFSDRYGKKRIGIDASGEQPIQDFYGKNGTTGRLKLGLYPGDERPDSEAGLPFTSLHDNEGRMRLLFRITNTKNKAPVMVMKDTKGRDRIIMGTALSDDDEEPFLAYIDKFGQKHMVFGKF